jgi:hypothetical protein
MGLLALDERDKHEETDRHIEVRGEKYGRKRVGGDNIKLRGFELHQ